MRFAQPPYRFGVSRRWLRSPSGVKVSEKSSSSSLPSHCAVLVESASSRGWRGAVGLPCTEQLTSPSASSAYLPPAGQYGA